MKIEQRIGRVDRIGQQRDVEVYNFILADTVETRVKDPVLPLDTYSINDERIIKHLRKELHQDAHANLMSVKIQDFTGEKGWFMLWHLSVAASGKGGKSIPIFINENGILRPLAGKRIWSALLDKTRTIIVSEGAPADEDTINMLTEAAQDYAYDTFSEMATEYERQIEENHRKYGYALRLRIEAAEHIGIENIKQHKLKALAQEKEEMEARYQLDNIDTFYTFIVLNNNPGYLQEHFCYI